MSLSSSQSNSSNSSAALSSPRVSKRGGNVITKKSKFASLKDNSQDVSSSGSSSCDALLYEQSPSMIGPLTTEQRLIKVLHFFEKKRNMKQRHVYRCRAQVAEKRLRIKGRFVTKLQAFAILGLSQNELVENQQI